MRIIHIAPNFTSQESAVIASSNARRNLLRDMYGEGSVIEYNLLGRNNSIRQYFCSIFFKRYPQINLKMENKIVKAINDGKIDLAIIETTRYGFLLEKLKKRTLCKTLVFVHDAEVLRQKSVNMVYKNERQFIKWFFQTCLFKNNPGYNESRSIKYADKLAVLHKRDSELIEKMYSRKAELEIPICLEDQYSKYDGSFHMPDSEPPALLFVGGNYPPNIEGISFFIDNVLDKIPWRLRVVGKCADVLRERYSSNPKLELIGAVPELEPYYISSGAVIAPIFSGGGMKTKTVEALMFGKNVYGTTESFTGIKGEASKIGGLCNTAEEFIEALSSAECPAFNQYNRELYKKYYSIEAEERLIRRAIEVGKAFSDEPC